jgi:hypothetical protein
MGQIQAGEYPQVTIEQALPTISLGYTAAQSPTTGLRESCERLSRVRKNSLLPLRAKRLLPTVCWWPANPQSKLV